MTTVIRIDDEVRNALKRRAVEFDLVFEPPNSVLRRMLGLDTNAIAKERGEGPANLIQSQRDKRQPFGKFHTAMAVRDTITGQVYLSKYKAGLAFKNEFPNIGDKYLWYQSIRKYPGRFVEVATGKRIE